MMQINPYIAGNPVGDSDAFVGRADVLREVLRMLRHPQGNALLLFGQRRIGKTSILQHLEARVPQEGPYYTVYFDLQDKAEWPVSRLVTELAQTIASRLDNASPVELEADPLDAFRRVWLPATLATLPEGSALVLLFDEFDVLTDPQGESVAQTFFHYLRKLMDEDRARLKFTFVIGRNVSDLSNIALSLFKGTPHQRVSLLNYEDTVALAKLSEINETLHWSNEAIERVCQLTNGHPFLTQMLCSQVWEQQYEDDPVESPTVMFADVDNAVTTTLDRSGSSLEWLWDGLGPAERVVASALAESGSAPITQEQLGAILQESGVRVIQEFENAAHQLQEWDILEPSDGGYRFRVELLRQWLVEHKPLRLVQEELDRVEPAADHLFRAASGLYRAGKLQEALTPLRQAVVLNPNHIQATLLLAELLLAQNQVDESIENLERLHKLRPSLAQSRLVQALLMRSRETEDEETKLTFYSKILELIPGHPEASSEYQRIWEKRGDDAMENFEFEAAAEAYAKAELDEKAALARKKQALETLDAQAQSFLLDKRWQEAAEIYKQLVAQAIDNQTRHKWELRRDDCREEAKLEDLFAQGSGYLKQGNWEQAQRAFAEIVYIRPRYQNDRQLAAWLLMQSVWEVPTSTAVLRRAWSITFRVARIVLITIGILALSSSVIIGLVWAFRALSTWFISLDLFTNMQWWVSAILVALGLGLLLALIIFFVFPWIKVRTFTPPPKGYVLVCRHGKAERILSTYSIGMSRRANRITIGGNRKKAHIFVSGLKPIEFYITGEEYIAKIFDAERGVIKGTLRDIPTDITTSNMDIRLRIGLDQTKLKC